MSEMKSPKKLNSKKAAFVLLMAATFVLAVPYLPLRPYHLLFWAGALLAEIVLIAALRPLEQNSN